MQKTLFIEMHYSMFLIYGTNIPWTKNASTEMIWTHCDLSVVKLKLLNQWHEIISEGFSKEISIHPTEQEQVILVWEGGFQLMQILGLLGMYFDAAVVFWG